VIDIGTEHVEQVHVVSLPIEAMHRLLDRQEGWQLNDAIERTRALLAGRVVWNVNSTAALARHPGPPARQKRLCHSRPAGQETHGATRGASGPPGRRKSCPGDRGEPAGVEYFFIPW
jgi:hypothetical protein